MCEGKLGQQNVQIQPGLRQDGLGTGTFWRRAVLLQRSDPFQEETQDSFVPRKLGFVTNNLGPSEREFFTFLIIYRIYVNREFICSTAGENIREPRIIFKWGKLHRRRAAGGIGLQQRSHTGTDIWFSRALLGRHAEEILPRGIIFYICIHGLSVTG